MSPLASRGAQPLRLALLTPTFLPKFCGAEIVHHNLAKQFLEMGHQPVVVTSSRVVRQLHRSGLKLPYPVVAFPSRLLRWAQSRPRLARLLSAFWLERLQRRYGFDIWHVSNLFPSGVLCGAWAAKRGLPMLVRSEGQDILVEPSVGYGLRLDPLVDEAIRCSLSNVSCFVAITQQIAEAYKAMGVEGHRVRQIANGVDLAAFDLAVHPPTVRARYAIPPQKFLFLCVCRNHPVKGLAHLLDAVGRLRGQRDDFALLLVGRGIPQLRERVQSQGLGETVFLLDEVGSTGGTLAANVQAPAKELVEIYKAADAFVFPSLSEAFGMVLVEAMAAGLPVITTGASGCREVVREGLDALVVPPADPEALAAAMRHWLDHPEEVQRWRSISQARAKAFDWNPIAQTYISLYQDILQKGSVKDS